jgi:hypothetical protein
MIPTSYSLDCDAGNGNLASAKRHVFSLLSDDATSCSLDCDAENGNLASAQKKIDARWQSCFALIDI